MKNINNKNHTHDGASWPYHYNKRKHMMIPCQTNPCRYHSNGNDFTMNSYDEANNILNTILSKSGINNTNNLSSSNVNIMLNEYLSKQKNTSKHTTKNITNKSRIIIPNDNVKHVALKRSNDANITSMITSNEPTGKLSKHTGEYYIYCSPVNASDTDEDAAHKIQEFCDYVSMLGIFKISNAELIRGLTSKQGVMLSFHVSNDNEYNMMFKHDGILQKLANDYDDGNGLTVIRKGKNPIANQSYVTVHESANTIRKDLTSFGFNVNDLKLYEYFNATGAKTCVYVNKYTHKNDVISDFLTKWYSNKKQIRTDIKVFRKEQRL